MRQELQDLAQALTGKGKVITFKSNSVLEGVESFNKKEDVVLVSKTLASKINNELIFIKNKLIPLMDEFSKLCAKKIETLSDDSDISKYTINIIDIPDLIKELKISGHLDDKRSPLELGSVSMGLMAPSPEVIREYIRKEQGLSVYTEQISGKYKDEDLLNFWDKYLSNISESNTHYIELFRNPASHFDDIILLYLILEAIKTEKPAHSSVPDNIYSTVMPVYYNEVKNLLAIINDNITADRKIGRLVISISNDGYTINVDKDNYDKFLEEGGTPDALFGLAVSGAYSVENSFVTDIRTKADEYTKHWENKIKLDSYTAIANIAKKYRAVYQLVLKQFYEAYIPEDLQSELEVNYHIARDALEKLTYKLDDNEILDYNRIARDVIGKIMFGNTNFTLFTDKMLGYLELNKSFNEKDAATFASFDMIIDYLVQQLDIDKYR